jgi:hypothetical protein
MGSPVTAIPSSYVSLLSDISPSSSASQSPEAPLGFFSQFLNEAVANSAAVATQPASSSVITTPNASQAAAAAAPKTIQVNFDTNPGPMYGRPIAPEGSAETGQWAVLPDGSYFSDTDVTASGLATLHPPPAGWQNTQTGQTLEALFGEMSGILS